MRKILLTGMTSAQASSTASSKAMSFAGVMYTVLSEAGHDVLWVDPSLALTSKDLDNFDAVIVGIAPLTSIAANRAYGALSVIDILWDSPKLTLFIDAPQVNQIEFSFKSVVTAPDNFTKKFFSYRKGYSEVLASPELKARLLSCVEKLYTAEWPRVMYPALPWSKPDAVASLLPGGAVDVVGINLDAHIIKDVPHGDHRRVKWSVDNYKEKWIQSAVLSLTVPHVPMKWNKGWTDDQVMDQINRSIGVLIAPSKREGSWWTYRIPQALSAYTPVVTDWKESKILGEGWDLLAPSVEDLSDETRHLLAAVQRGTYLANIPSKQAAIKLLEGTIKLSKKK